MTILLISSSDFFSTYGGGQVYVKNIADEMIRQGMDITIISPDNTGNEIDCLIDEGNTIKSVEIKSATTINSHFFRDWIFIKI